MPQSIGCLDDFPRCRLAHLPTPIEPMPNLSRQLGGARAYIKRDDCTGLALGGNKIRQLEYYVGAAEAEGADTLLITGAVQSNFVRSTVAAAAKRGMACHVQLEERVPDPSGTYRVSGNVLLDRLMGATVHSYPEGENEAGADHRLGEIADVLKREGRRPYIVPLSPGHPPIAALGYVDAARELVQQLSTLDEAIDEIYVASGSGSTHAGLLFGLRALGCPIPVLGVCVRRAAKLQLPRIADKCKEIAQLLRMVNPVTSEDVRVDDRVLPPGYGRMNLAVANAIRSSAASEAILLDPVYTGRVMACLMMVAQERERARKQCVLMIHSGGTPALFAYEPEVSASLV
ncbi:MAG: D-cysteine desulfhydrase family protein [Hyphomicrobiaceae bacterium]